MKKLLIILLLCAPLAAQTCTPSASQTCTPNVSLALPVRNSQNWDTALNSNFTLLDNLLSGAQTIPNIKPANVNGILYVDGTKYRTVSQAYAALPSCTGSDGNIFAHCGEIRFTGSLPAETSTLAITGPVRIDGGHEEQSVLNCNVAGPCITIASTPFSTTHGPVLENFTINNSNSSTAVIGIQAGGVAEPVFRNLHFVGFQASQVDMLWNNPTSTWSERVVIDHVHFDNPTTSATCLKFTDTNSANDFFYWRVINAECNIGPGGVAVDLENDAQVVGGFWSMTINTDVNTATATSVFLINGTSAFGSVGSGGSTYLANQVYITVDNSGLANPVTLWKSAAGTSTYISGQIIGSDSSVYSNSISGTFVYLLNNTFPGSATANFTDVSILAHSNSSGPGNLYTWHYQNPGSSRTLTVNDPGANDTLVFAAATQTLTNKSTSAGPLSGTVASGTAAMTTAAIGSGACGSTVTVAATGVATTDAIETSFNASVGANPGVLIVQKWPTSNNVNFAYCNPTAGSVTPSAATINWRVGR